MLRKRIINHTLRSVQKREILTIIVLIVLYLLMGHARSVQQNPCIDGATIAVNMIVPVIGGILFGARVGFCAGILGTLLNALTLPYPACSFERLAIVPHGIMGFTAGWFREKLPYPLLTGSLMVGHLLNLLFFTIFGLITVETITNIALWFGIAYETITGAIAIIIIVSIYRLGV